MNTTKYYQRYDPNRVKIVKEKAKNSSLVSLLLIPLFILLGMGAYFLYERDSEPENANTVNDSGIFGIGGAPPPTITPSPTFNPEIEYEGELDSINLTQR